MPGLSKAPRPSIVHLPPGPGRPATLLAFLLERFPQVEREVWLDRFARGLVQGREGVSFDAAMPYRPHLEVRYFREVAAEPEWDPPVVLHADAELVVVDKPHFQPVTPSGAWVRGSLLYQVAAWLEDRGEAAAELTPVHRLDRATAGLVVFSRRAATRGAYGLLFEERRVEKVYEALARLPAALPAERFWQVRSRIVPGEPFFRMLEGAGSPNSESAIELVAIETEGDTRWGRFELRPETGKKHQLRLHMAALGFPIVGDRWYPELLAEAEDDPSQPLQLLAKRLAFPDPLTGEPRSFVSRQALRIPASGS